MVIREIFPIIEYPLNLMRNAEGREMAKKFDCVFERTSAAIGHNVDTLLLALLKQLRVSQHKQLKVC